VSGGIVLADSNRHDGEQWEIIKVPAPTPNRVKSLTGGQRQTSPEPTSVMGAPRQLGQM